MGCDIHIVLERRAIGATKWVGVFCTDNWIGSRPLIARRDYAFFAEVAQVRGEGSEPRIYPRNIPEDVSRLAWQSYMEAPTDHHSPSHMRLGEFTDAWFRANASDALRNSGDRAPRQKFASYDLLGVSDYYDAEDRRYEYRVVFWFDN